MAFAAAARRLAPRYWIQTPYRYFPVEPHWLFPGFAQLPVPARAWVTRRWPLGSYAGVAGDRRRSVDHALEIELLSRTEMGHYFPDADIRCERVAGIPKSLIAVR